MWMWNNIHIVLLLRYGNSSYLLVKVHVKFRGIIFYHGVRYATGATDIMVCGQGTLVPAGCHTIINCRPLATPPTCPLIVPLRPSNVDARRCHPPPPCWCQSPLLPCHCPSVAPTAVAVAGCRCHWHWMPSSLSTTIECCLHYLPSPPPPKFNMISQKKSERCQNLWHFFLHYQVPCEPMGDHSRMHIYI